MSDDSHQRKDEIIREYWAHAYDNEKTNKKKLQYEPTAVLTKNNRKVSIYDMIANLEFSG